MKVNFINSLSTTYHYSIIRTIDKIVKISKLERSETVRSIPVAVDCHIPHKTKCSSHQDSHKGIASQKVVNNCADYKNLDCTSCI